MPSWLDRLGQTARSYLDRAREAPGTYHVRGVRVVVVNPRPDIETSFVLARLDEALALVEQHQPWRLAHLRRDLRVMSVAPFPCRGAYFPTEHTVLTELSFLARAPEFTPAQLASSIVHEGTHARVHRMGERLGFDWAGRDMAREERLCRRAELAFGESLPADLGGPVILRAVQSLQLSDAEVAPVVNWVEAHAAKERADAAAIEAWRRQRADG
jgi:hypothetical protein